MEITKDKITDIFCIIDGFCEEYDKDIEKMSLKAPDGRRHRKRSCVMSRSEIMTILVCFHFNQFRNFKHYYLFYVREHLKDLFPRQLSYNRFVELESRVCLDDAVPTVVLLWQMHGHKFRRQYMRAGMPQ